MQDQTKTAPSTANSGKSAQIISTERQFLELRGDYTELVKFTADPDRLTDYNGVYLYRRAPSENRFIKKSADGNSIVKITNRTGDLKFDGYMGIWTRLNIIDIVGPRHSEFEQLKLKLIESEQWILSEKDKNFILEKLADMQRAGLEIFYNVDPDLYQNSVAVQLNQGHITEIEIHFMNGHGIYLTRQETVPKTERLRLRLRI
ncbi:MAG: hypothetical protein ABR981_00030 [Candidatus Micrarchaeaceae archaeon]|jgi:hypothetical protein